MKNRIIAYVKNFLLNACTKINVPYSAQIELTQRCNAKCRFCSFPHIQNEHSKNHEMDTAHVKRLIDEINELGAIALSFTGGEPTLRKDLPELISHSGLKNNLLTGVASNGYLFPNLMKEYDLDGLNYILLSLDYPFPKMHNAFRGINVFDKIIETIKLANERDIKTVISTVVMKDNLQYLDRLCELADHLNCSIELFPCENIIRHLNGKTHKIENIDNYVPSIPIWAMNLKNLRKNYDNIITDPLTINIIEEGGFGGNPNHQDILRCHVAKAYLFVRYDGYISFPCKINPLKTFNTLKYSLSEIFNSLEARSIMEKHDSYEFCDGCRLGCAIASSMTAKWKTVYSKFVKSFIKGNLK
ncbi:MAG: Antilisterial bacteriocin subtilosin biosynthesis protein AlbA [Promethearchaeota archaeon]|nr:MAG: Antilisterial bacteriocin subtilosin biosynthesis protein AlbA [Candidatus Lokiarchaeota archaeon]